MDIPPNQTIYVNNLNEKLHKDVLKRSLYCLFCQYGPVLDIIAMKTPKMRGQAFLVFRDVAAASNALRSMQGFVFYGKPLRIAFAKTKSQLVAGKKGLKGSAALTASTNGALPPAVTDGNTDSVMEVSVPGQKNNILYLSGLPEGTNETALTKVFGEMAGYKEVRVVAGRSDIAFVEFLTDENAAAAKEAGSGFKLSPEHAGLEIVFAK